MSSLNQVTLIGNLGKDPEIRRLNNGDAVANFSIATSEKWTDKGSGEKRERTEWHRVVAWGKIAEIIEKYVKKGDKIMVQGKLQTRSWEKDGHKNYTTEVVLQGFDAKMVMLSSKGDGGGRSESSSESRYGGTTERGASALASEFELDDEIPF